MVKTVVNPHRYPTHVPYNSVFKLTFASSGQHEDLFSLFLYKSLFHHLAISEKVKRLSSSQLHILLQQISEERVAEFLYHADIIEVSEFPSGT